MIRYRHFRNADPPGIAAVWRSQPPLPGRAGDLTSLQFEQFVFSKPYFERAGLIVAVDGEQIVGFSHAGFGVSDDGNALSKELGVVCQVLVKPHEEREKIERELLAQAEDYLRRSGAGVIYGGGIFPINPFYLGLYGGSELPGVLASDVPLVQLFQSSGYREIDRCIIFECDLATFRAPVDRKQMYIRRNFNIEAAFDPPAANWWEACTLGQTDRTRFVLRPRNSSNRCATVTFWDMEPLATSRGLQTVGLVQLATEASQQRQGMATFLIAEALKQLAAHGVKRCQVQTVAHNTAAVSLYKKLGFVKVDEGLVFRKEH